jgi:iron(III) transport system ATP-binding protein
MTPLISLEGVTFRLQQSTVLSDLSLTVGESEVLALLGPSGCGKTSVLRLILGFNMPDWGKVRLEGEVVAQDGRRLVPPEERNLAVVFQDLALWPHMTVHANLAFGLEARRVPREERETRIADLLQRVGLSGKERRYPAELSGGERQRVAIARALVLRPRAVLFDEPLSSLDVGLKRELLAMFRELLKDQGTPAIYVTHDPREAVSLGDRIAVMDRGQVIQQGTLDALRSKPANAFVESLLDDLRWMGTMGSVNRQF